MNKEFRLPPEVEEGNKEYKRKLCGLSRYRFQQLQSQMKWRIDEGNGTAIYFIGVDDDGTIVKLKGKERKESIKNIKKIASQIDCYVDTIEFKNNYFEIIIKKNIKLIDFIEKRIVFLGNSNVGKSTLISVLCSNQLDNGKGSARMNLFNHKHEMFTGVTSSISIQDYQNENVKFALLDLPGKLKYKKTKYYGLLSHDPEIAILVIDQTTTQKSISDIYNFIKFLKIPILFVRNKLDLNINLKKLNYLELENIISVSCLDGTNLNLLKDKINTEIYNTNNLSNYQQKFNNTKLSEILLDNTIIFQISENYYLTDLGLIVSGILLNGELEINSKMKLGPIRDDEKIIYHNVIITSIHCYQTPYVKLSQDHLGTIVIKFKDPKLNIKNIYSKLSKGTYLSDIELPLINEANVKIKILSKFEIKIGQKINIFVRNISSESEIKDLSVINSNHDFDYNANLKFSKKLYIRKFDKFIFDNSNYVGYGIFI